MATIRTDKDLNPPDILARQSSLGLTLPRAVAVVGCGGVGSWTALFLALAGVPKLYLFDHDKVSDNNLNRLMVPKEDIGTSKSEAIADTIISVRPECDILALAEWTPETADALKLAEQIDWLVCTTDTLANRRACYKWVGAANDKRHELPRGQEKLATELHYIEAAAEGEFGSATGSPAEWASDLERDPGYASVPVHVGPCVLAASMACYHVLHNKPMDYLIRMGYDGQKLSVLTAQD